MGKLRTYNTAMRPPVASDTGLSWMSCGGAARQTKTSCNTDIAQSKREFLRPRTLSQTLICLDADKII